MKFNLNGYQSTKAPETKEFENYVFPENTVVHFEVTKVRDTNWGISLQIKAHGMVEGKKHTGFFFANINPESVQRVGALCESLGINPMGEIDSDDFEGKSGYGITKTYARNSGEKANDMKFFLRPDDRRAVSLKGAMATNTYNDTDIDVLFGDSNDASDGLDLEETDFIALNF